MSTNPYERLEAIMKHYGIGVYELAARCKYNSPQVFYRIKSGGVKKISQSIAGRIKLSFPDINEIWLITGSGKMLLETKDICESQDVVILREEIKRLREEIKKKDTTIDNLVSSITNLTQKLNT